MKKTLSLFLTLTLCLGALAQTKASSRSGNTGVGATIPKREASRETATRVTFLGPKTGWGFTKAGASFYSPDGKNLGTLPGGTLFKYSDVKSTSKNPVLVSSVKRETSWQGPYLIDCTDVAAYDGDPDTVDPDTVRNLQTYFRTTGQIAERQETLLGQQHAANPHYNSARQTQKAYLDSVEKAAAMEKQMNTLTGIRKTKALDELRALKYEQARIKAKADQEAAAYKRWKDAHPPDLTKLAADPLLKSLEAERQQAKAKVAPLLPPES